VIETNRVSVVIPAFNEATHIVGCVQALRQAFNGISFSLEIIVVDNGSTDDTARLASKVANKVVRTGKRSISAARNLGALEAKHNIIGFIDADVVVTAEWAEQLASRYRRLQKTPLFIAGYQYSVGDNCGWIEKNWFANLKERYFAGGNLITTKQLIGKIGGFDETLMTGEDYDFCIRGIEAGATVFRDPGFRVIHLGNPSTFLGFVSREYWHGQGDFVSVQRFCSSPVAIIAVAYLLCAFLIGIFTTSGSWKLATMLAFGVLLFNFLLTAWRFRKSNIRAILINSFLHFGYFSARSISIFPALYFRYKTSKTNN